MKIAGMEFKEFAARKPVSLTDTGEFLTAAQVIEKKQVRLSSLFSLSRMEQVELTVQRYILEPDFKMAVVGRGVYQKDELILNIRDQTDLGVELVRAEIGYCEELLRKLPGAKPVRWPEIPKPPFQKEYAWRKWPPFVRRKPCLFFKLQSTVLFCENTTDSVTTPFAEYRITNVHPAFAARGFKVKVLKGVDDVRVNFEREIKKPLTVYGGGVGHGSYTAYSGYWNNHVLEVGDYNASEVKGKSFHFLSCQTGAQLGPDTVDKEAKSYAGYNENFVLQWDDPGTPAVDEFMLFAQSDSTYDIMIANGSTAQAAYDGTVQAFNAAIDQVPNQVAATYLTLDRDRLVLHGDPSSTVKPCRVLKVCFPILERRFQKALINAGQFVD